MLNLSGSAQNIMAESRSSHLCFLVIALSESEQLFDKKLDCSHSWIAASLVLHLVAVAEPTPASLRKAPW